MNQISNTSKLIVHTFALLLVSCSTCFATHPYHVSYAEVEWNAKTGNFEVALCVWPADLEKAIAAQENKVVDLDSVKELDSLLEKYVAKRFKVTSASQNAAQKTVPQPIRWIGHEKNLKKAWLYFEVSGDKTTNDWTIENRVFFEMNEEQANHVQLKLGNKVENVASTHAKSSISLTTKN
jgi:hypothetical protein